MVQAAENRSPLYASYCRIARRDLSRPARKERFCISFMNGEPGLALGVFSRVRWPRSRGTQAKAIRQPSQRVSGSPPRANGSTTAPMASSLKQGFCALHSPNSADGIEKYLSSGMIRGVGPVYAKKLVRAFGDRCSTSSRRHRTGCVKSTASDQFALPAFSLPGPSRRQSGKLWSSCIATVSARRGRCGSSRPMVLTPSRS